MAALFIRTDGKLVDGTGKVRTGPAKKISLAKTRFAGRLYDSVFLAGFAARDEEKFCKGSYILAVMRRQNPRGDEISLQGTAFGLADKMAFVAIDPSAGNSVAFEQIYNEGKNEIEYVIAVPPKKSVWAAFKEGGTLGEKIASARQMLENRREMLQNLVLKLEEAAKSIVEAEWVSE